MNRHRPRPPAVQQHHYHRRHRLVPWQRRGLYAVSALLVLTGVAWLALHYTLGAGSGEGELPHPGEAWLMRLHGLAGFGGLFVLGVLAAGHVPQGWRLSHHHRWADQRTTGVALCSAAAVLTVTGYLLYYFAPEGIRPALGWLHTGAGLVMALVALRHRQGRQIPAATPASAPASKLD